MYKILRYFLLCYNLLSNVYLHFITQNLFAYLLPVGKMIVALQVSMYLGQSYLSANLFYSSLRNTKKDK